MVNQFIGQLYTVPISHADHTDRPSLPRQANDEKAWTALYKVSMDRSRTLVEELKGGLDVNLIFV
jgi:hypothetical protein